MPAVTVDRVRRYVVGNKRVVAAQVDIAADQDTYNTRLRRIESATATPNNSAAAQIGITISGGTLTFRTGGVESNVLVRAEGV